MMRIAYLAAVVSLASAAFAPKAQASIIWSDSFESGNFNAWTSTSGNWTIITSSTAAHGGLRGADIKGPNDPNGDLLSASISTINNQGIGLGYWYKVRDTLESADFVYVEWTADKAHWQTLAAYSNAPTSDWQYASFVLPAEADNNPNFSFRIRANLGNSTDRLAFDDFAVVSNAVPEPASLVSGLGFICLLALRRRR